MYSTILYPTPFICVISLSIWRAIMIHVSFRLNIPSYKDSDMFPKHNLVQYHGQNEELIPSNATSGLEKEFIIRAYVNAD